MVEQAPPWPKQGPASYFPSIEKKYGRSIAQWQQVIAGWSGQAPSDPRAPLTDRLRGWQ
jgi:hypothetical protein